MAAVEKRGGALRSAPRHRLASRQRPASAGESVRPLEGEGPFPKADDAFDQGVRTLDLTKWIERKNPPGGSESEGARQITWEGPWRRGEEVEEELRAPQPESFGPVKAPGGEGAERPAGGVTKGVRRKRAGRQRVGIVPEKEAWSDAPRGGLTDAWPGERGRVIETWKERWPAAGFPESRQPVPGVEAARGAPGGSG